jgi:hypothetical protein
MGERGQIAWFMYGRSPASPISPQIGLAHEAWMP